jgi:hypothetical protein
MSLNGTWQGKERDRFRLRRHARAEFGLKWRKFCGDLAGKGLGRRDVTGGYDRQSTKE